MSFAVPSGVIHESADYRACGLATQGQLSKRRLQHRLQCACSICSGSDSLALTYESDLILVNLDIPMTDQRRELRNGVPSEDEYAQLLKSEQFDRMKTFSAAFLADNEEPLRPYCKRWISNPLLQWSRQWEYPFVYDRVVEVLSDVEVRVLDAGCGATFFPFFLSMMHPTMQVECCDYDASLLPIYEQITGNTKANVHFSVSDLRQLPFDDDSFDIVYCVSVLEHTNAYGTIVEEFRRVLRPGGRIIVTFDISLDGTHDIPVDQAEELLSLLVRDGGDRSSNYPRVERELKEPAIVTTNSFADSQPELLPWAKPTAMQHVKSLVNTGRPKSWPTNLTFYCLNVDKR